MNNFELLWTTRGMQTNISTSISMRLRSRAEGYLKEMLPKLVPIKRFETLEIPWRSERFNNNDIVRQIERSVDITRERYSQSFGCTLCKTLCTHHFRQWLFEHYF